MSDADDSAAASGMSVPASCQSPPAPARVLRGRGRFQRRVEARGPLAISPRDRFVRERLVRWVNEGRVVLQAIQRMLDEGRPEPAPGRAGPPEEPRGR